MPITGLLLTLSQEPCLQCQALARLQARPELQIGPAVDRWLPVALAVEDDAQGRELHDWMLASAGVEYVDVVCVNFEDEVAGGVSTGADLGTPLPNPIEAAPFKP